MPARIEWADGPAHMARDLALMDQVLETGRPVVRFYRWSPPTLSLGKHQTVSDDLRAACLRLGLGIVQRPSGGGAVLHEGDLTYAVAVPHLTHLTVQAAYAWLTEGLRLGLQQLGIATDVPRLMPGRPPLNCFAHATQADLSHRGRKLAGSAQWRRKGVVLQHGSLLMDPDWRLREALFGPSEAAVSLTDILGQTPDYQAVADALNAGFESIWRMSARSSKGFSPKA